MDTILTAVIHGSDTNSRDALRRLLTEHGRWLIVQEYVQTASVLCTPLTYCGYPNESLAWYERVHAQLYPEKDAVPDHRFLLLGAANSAMLGRDKEAAQHLGAARAVVEKEPGNGDSWRNYLAVALWAAVEMGQLDEFEVRLADMRRLRSSARRTWPVARAVWVFAAQGRLAQCLAAPDEERTALLTAARRVYRRASPRRVDAVLACTLFDRGWHLSAADRRP